MRILYLTRLTFSSDKANVYNTAHTCAALAAAGASVVLVSADDGASAPETLAAFRQRQGVAESFEIVSLTGRSNRYKYGSATARTAYSTILANLELIQELWRRRRETDVVYVRDAYLAPLGIFASYIARKPVFFEAHAVLVGKRNAFLGNMLARASTGVIAITHALAQYYKKLNPNVTVSYCAAAEPERFALVTQSKTQLRHELDLPPDACILCYTGNLSKTGNNDSYGIEDIVAAMPYIKDAIFVGVGKKHEKETIELESLARSLGVSERVIFRPWTTKDHVAKYLLACDILLIPAAGARIGNAPSKMFDYLVSGRPIVAADTEAIREVLTDKKTALLVDYKTPQAWAAAVDVLRDERLRDELVAHAQQEGKRYTWESRGQEILNFLSKRAAV